MFDLIRADLDGALGRKAPVLKKFGSLCFHLGIQAVLLYRASRWLHLHHLDPFAVLVQYVNSVLTGAQISRHAVIGKGLVIGHPVGVSVSGSAVIGDYCVLNQAVIGRFHPGDRPRIGDHFEAGVGAKVLGNVDIGNDVRVGANSVVMSSLGDGVSVLGIPAKVIFRRATLQRTPNREPYSRDEIRVRLRALLADTMGENSSGATIDDSTSLLGRGIGLDSIDVLNLVCAIEKEFALTLDESEFTQSSFQTIGSLATFIEKRTLMEAEGSPDDVEVRPGCHIREAVR